MAGLSCHLITTNIMSKNSQHAVAVCKCTIIGLGKMEERNEKQQCFPAAAPADTRVLILGSFPGERSLQKKQYYAHPRNVFWQIMGELFQFDSTIAYQQRMSIVNAHKIGIWDVMQSCCRHGSLDSRIETTSIVANDFTHFFDCNPELRLIAFNGCKAESEFKKRILPKQGNLKKDIEMIRMPSTSPTMATMNYQEKYRAWSRIKKYL